MFDASAKRLFAASLAGRVVVFDAQSGRRIGWVDSLEHGGLEAMAVSPDARFVATGHSTGAVVLWQWREDQQYWPRRVLLQHGAGIRGLAFGADGRTLVSAGAALSLPPSTQLMGTHAAGGGWLASSASEHFRFADDPREWLKTACALAGRKLSDDEWRRHVGSEQPYRPAC